MSRQVHHLLAICTALAVAGFSDLRAEKVSGLDKTGKPDLKSAGPLTFGPEGVLFVGDPLGAAVFAIGVEASSKGSGDAIKVESIDKKIAAALGAEGSAVRVNDL